MADEPWITEETRRTVAVRVGEVLNDFLDRRGAGESVSVDDLVAAHPELAIPLRAHLRTLQQLDIGQAGLSHLLRPHERTEPTADSAAARFDNYRVLGVLGLGATGIVLKAYDAQLDRHIALKVLRPEAARNAGVLARFQREARSGAALQHPNIVVVHSIGTFSDTPYIAMELINGRTLAQVIADEAPLPAPSTRTIMRQLFSGLACAHDAGVIHRDVKPANILLSEPGGHVKIADFGLARITSAMTHITVAGAVFGTPQYMSPEQARGDAHIDHRSDLYSAGVVLYEMITGQTPFDADSPSAVIHGILHAEPLEPRELNPSTDRHLARLALRLMAKRPDDRLDSARHALGALEKTAPVALPERRRKRLWHLTTAVLAAMLTFAAYRLWPADSDTLSDVIVETVDGSTTRNIFVQFEGTGRRALFHRFPRGVLASDAAIAHHGDSAATRTVFAGVRQPIKGDSLFEFDVRGEQLHAWNLSVNRQWPDCARPSQWYVRGVATADLNDAPGDEIVVVAADAEEYPTRVSVIDRQTGTVGTTFWHLGQLNKPLVVPDFFSDHAPAIVLCGLNNKLDGFSDLRPGDGPTYTDHDRVSVVVILDPRRMAGMGPPRSARFADLGTATVYAYAFLNLPAAKPATQPTRSANPRRSINAAPVAFVRAVDVAPYDSDPQSAPWFRVSLSRSESLSSTVLVVDRNLEIVTAAINDRETTTEPFWRHHWIPIIQDSRYLDD